MERRQTIDNGRECSREEGDSSMLESNEDRVRHAFEGQNCGHRGGVGECCKKEIIPSDIVPIEEEPESLIS